MKKRVRMTAITAAGTTYSASVDRDVSKEALEALDALADAVMRQWKEGKLPKPGQGGAA